MILNLQSKVVKNTSYGYNKKQEIITQPTERCTMKKFISTIFALFIVQLFTNSAVATERIGRLGVGITNNTQNNITALSIKLQRSKSFAYSSYLGLDSSDTGGWIAGLKFYRNLFEEPQLSFYTFGAIALINQKSTDNSSKNGFEIDLGLGSEFSFAGLESLGFSADFGVSLTKIDTFTIKTQGSKYIIGSVHFYL